MTQEDKQLLLKDLCVRLPYGVKVSFHGKTEILGEAHIYPNVQTFVGESGILYDAEFVKPYLRPMSSMTEEEINELDCVSDGSLSFLNGEYIEVLSQIGWVDSFKNIIKGVNWLIANHFDYRGLIPMGLALEAPEGMYKNE